jgi:hypothetical protein
VISVLSEEVVPPTLYQMSIQIPSKFHIMFRISHHPAWPYAFYVKGAKYIREQLNIVQFFHTNFEVAKLAIAFPIGITI